MHTWRRSSRHSSQAGFSVNICVIILVIHTKQVHPANVNIIVYLYVYTCIYECIHTRTHTHAHTPKHAFVCLYMSDFLISSCVILPIPYWGQIHSPIVLIHFHTTDTLPYGTDTLLYVGQIHSHNLWSPHFFLLGMDQVRWRAAASPPRAHAPHLHAPDCKLGRVGCGRQDLLRYACFHHGRIYLVWITVHRLWACTCIVRGGMATHVNKTKGLPGWFVTPAQRRNVVYWNPNGRSSMISTPAPSGYTLLVFKTQLSKPKLTADNKEKNPEGQGVLRDEDWIWGSPPEKGPGRGDAHKPKRGTNSIEFVYL